MGLPFSQHMCLTDLIHAWRCLIYVWFKDFMLKYLICKNLNLAPMMMNYYCDKMAVNIVRKRRFMLKWVMIFLEWIISLKCPYVRKYLVYIFAAFFNHSVIELQAVKKRVLPITRLFPNFQNLKFSVRVFQWRWSHSRLVGQNTGIWIFFFFVI